MTALLEKALEALRKLPPDTQDAYARALLETLPDESGLYKLTDEERQAVKASMAQAERGEFVPDEEVAAFWRSLGL